MTERIAARCAENDRGRKRLDRLFLAPRAFADQIPRQDRTIQLRSAIERGCYRIPAHVLAACLMLEMLQ